MGRDRTRIERLEQLQDSSSLVNVTGTPPIHVTTPSPSVRNVSVTGLSGNNTGDQTIILVGDVTGSGTGQFATTLAAGQRRYTVASTSGTNTVTGTATPTPTAYAAGDLYIVTFTNANTSAATLNANGLGAKAIQFKQAALTGGEISAASTMALEYDGTQFQLVGSIGGGSGLSLAQVRNVAAQRAY